MSNVEKFYKMFSQLVELTNDKIGATVEINTPENWKHFVKEPTVTILTQRCGFIINTKSENFVLNLLPTLQIIDEDCRIRLADFIDKSF